MIGASYRNNDLTFRGLHRSGVPWEPLSILVDGRSVISAMIISFEEGVIAYWPIETDDEAWDIAENIFFTRKHGLYIVIGGDNLRYKYLGLCIYDKIILLVLNRFVNAERLARKLMLVLRRFSNVKNKS